MTLQLGFAMRILLPAMGPQHLTGKRGKTFGYERSGFYL